MTLVRTRALPELLSLREAIDRFFDDPFVAPREWLMTDRAERPAIDAYATPEAFVLKVAVPGLKPEDIHTTLAGDLLTVEGQYREEAEHEDKGYVHRELSRGELRRTVRLPEGLKTDAIEASYADGILTLTVPKLEETKPREIEVKVAA